MLAYVAYFHGNFPGGIFSKDGEVISAAADYMRACAIETLLAFFPFCFLGYFNGCGKTDGRVC